MTGILSFYRTSIGKKTVMAVTGLIGVGFVIAHLISNLSIFTGPTHLDDYAAFLRSTGPLLWIARGVLLAAVIAHIVAAVQLTIENRKARTSRYAYQRYVQAPFATRTLRWGGAILFLFIIYHIAHFTLGVAPLTPSEFEHGKVYNNVVYGFQNPIVAGIYIVAMLALGLHMLHGVWSMFHTLGLNNRRFNRVWRNLALLVALFLFLGNISIPIAVLLGVFKPV